MKSLLLVDLQNDFCKGGNLAIADGEEVVPIANKLMELFPIVVASQDWHPKNHLSFASQHQGRQVGDLIKLKNINQVLWPDHCIQGSFGAKLRENLTTKKITKVFQKGIHYNVDSYSAFYDLNLKYSTGLSQWLKQRKINDLFIFGLATEYCVKFTVLDALKEHFNTFVIRDGCRGVEQKAGDSAKAFDEMQKNGATIIENHQVSNYLA